MNEGLEYIYYIYPAPSSAFVTSQDWKINDTIRSNEKCLSKQQQISPGLTAGWRIFVGQN